MNTSQLDAASEPQSTRRCEHRTASGRQCRSSCADPVSHFCPRHAADLSSVLAVGRNAFESAEAVNHSLADLFTLLVEDRIAPRRAAVLAYIGSLLLRSLSAIDKETDREIAAARKPRPVRVVWNIGKEDLAQPGQP